MNNMKDDSVVMDEKTVRKCIKQLKSYAQSRREFFEFLIKRNDTKLKLLLKIFRYRVIADYFNEMNTDELLKMVA